MYATAGQNGETGAVSTSDTPQFPVFDLRITTPRLELRPVREADALALIDLADRGIHDPGDMPFLVPWTEEAAPDRWWHSFQHYAGHWAGLRPESWTLSFAVLADGDLVGNQVAESEDFPTSRTAETGSWIGRGYQGRGYGYEARIAILTLLMDGLGALVASTGAWHDNAASLRVTQKVGYEPNGEWLKPRRGVPTPSPRFRLTAQAWAEVRPDLPVTISGLDAALPQLGLA